MWYVHASGWISGLRLPFVGIASSVLEREADQVTVFDVLGRPELLESVVEDVDDLRLRAWMQGDDRHYLPVREAARARTAASILTMCSSAVARIPSPRSSSANPLSASRRAWAIHS